MTETTLGVLATPHGEGKIGSCGKIVPGMMAKVKTVIHVFKEIMRIFYTTLHVYLLILFSPISDLLCATALLCFNNKDPSHHLWLNLQRSNHCMQLLLARKVIVRFVS